MEISEEYRQRPPVLLSENLVRRPALLEQLPKARFVHMATHGFFAEQRFRSALAPPGTTYSVAALVAPDARGDELVAGRNPLVLCGVVLSGANRRASGPGILTGEEIVELDLGDAELVVLSACDTALGQAAGDEGVFSLQRAFGLAGARTVVASLWKVPDSATQQLMDRFYENVWKKRMPKVKAWRERRGR